MLVEAAGKYTEAIETYPTYEPPRGALKRVCAERDIAGRRMIFTGAALVLLATVLLLLMPNFGHIRLINYEIKTKNLFSIIFLGFAVACLIGGLRTLLFWKRAKEHLDP